jgi:threonine synthase
MVMAFRDGANTIAERHIVRAPTGLAEAILRGDPTASYPYVLEFIRDTGGCFTAPSEPDIQDARQMLLTLEGIDACFASATALAGVRQLAQLGWLKESEVVLVNLTGGIR